MSINVDELKVDIFDLISRSEGESINKSFAIYTRILKAESVNEQVELFKYACEFYGTKKSTKEISVPSIITEDEMDDLKNNYGKYVNGILDNLLRRNLMENDFYCKLWDAIINDTIILETEKEKVFALYYTFIDKRIPYFQLGESIEMSNEEFADILTRLTPIKQKIRFILSVPISSKTERSGYLLDLLDEYSGSPKERAVLMSYLIESVKKQRSTISSIMAQLDSETHPLLSLPKSLEELIEI